MGRKKKPENEQMITRVSIPVTKIDLDAVDARVRSLGMKRTEYLRFLIVQDLSTAAMKSAIAG